MEFIKLEALHTVYECVGCYATLPYPHCRHNCPDLLDDEGYDEEENYMRIFAEWYKRNVRRCRVITAEMQLSRIYHTLH